MQRDKPPIPPYFLLGIGIIAISFSSILIKWTSAPPAIIGMYRLLFTCILLLPWLWKEKADLFRLHPRDFLLLILSGAFLGLHFWFWIASLDETSVASSMIITALSPFFVVTGAFFFFRERFTKTQIVSMLLALLGTGVVAYGDIGESHSQFIGDISSLLGTIAVSVYMMFGQAVRKKISSTVYNVAVFFVASVELAVFTLFQHVRFVGYSPRDFGIFVLLAIVPTLFGHGLFNWLLKFLPASTISMTTLGEPIGAIILAAILLGQNVTVWQIVGGSLCIGGVYLFLKVKPRDKTGNTSRLQPQSTSDKMVVDETTR